MRDMACPTGLSKDTTNRGLSFLIKTQSWSPWETAIILDTQSVHSLASVSITVTVTSTCLYTKSLSGVVNGISFTELFIAQLVILYLRWHKNTIWMKYPLGLFWLTDCL